MRVFGSVARGRDGPHSDADLPVDLDVRTDGLLPLSAIADRLTRLVGERVDVLAAEALAPDVAYSALAEAVPF